MKRFAQIAAVAGALSMLVGFVVYSQQKVVQPDGYFKIATAGTGTNAATRAVSSPAVAPGSKSQAPLVQPPAAVVATNNFRFSSTLPGGPGIGPGLVASSSKSAVMFKPEYLTQGSPDQSSMVVSSPPARPSIPTGQVMFSTKSAPVITPSTFPNQRSVAMATNPPPRKPAP